MKMTELPVIGKFFSETEANALTEEAIALAEDEKKKFRDMKVPKSAKGLFSEVTHEGLPSQVAMRRDYIGEYSPDDIPLTTYSKMRWDGQVRLGLMAIKLPVISRAFWVECVDPDIQYFIQSALTPIWRTLLKSLLLGLDFGFSAHEKVFKIEEGFHVTSDDKDDGKVDYTRDSIIYKKIKSLHPETITFKYDLHYNFDGFIQNKGRQNQVELKSEKCFVYTHDKEFGNLFGWSRLKPVYPYWYTYWIIDAWHEVWLEKRGMPPVVVRHPIGSSVYGSDDAGEPVMKQNAQIARDVGKTMGPNAVITIPSNKMKGAGGLESEWGLDYFQDTSRGDVYVEAKRELDVHKLRALLVPERAVTQEASSGWSSGSATEQHVWLMLEGLKSLISDIEQHVSKYIVRPLVVLNFGDDAPEAKVKMEEIGRELSGALFQLYMQMAASGNAHPSVSKLEEILNVPGETDVEKKEREKSEKEQQESMVGGLGGGQYGNPYDNKNPPSRSQTQPSSNRGSFNRDVSEHARRLSDRIDGILRS